MNAFNAPGFRAASGGDRDKLVAAAREQWVKKLIDPSRNNPLLFFRDLKVSMLELPPDSEAVKALLGGERVDLKTLAASGARNGDPKAIAHSLDTVRRKAVSHKEEKGIDTLQMALGLASWPATDGGTPYQAPVLLVPLAIEARRQGGADSRLCVAGEPQVNPVLMHLLRDEVGVACDVEQLVKDCTEEDEEGVWKVDPARVHAGLAEQVVPLLEGFSISPRAVVANFYFARMPMVEDLKRNAAALGASTLIAAVAGHGETREALRRQQGAGDDARLDARKAEEEFFVLMSDSSQQEAIEAVESGRHLVIQGPPGTGKSQTIANLIAQSVSNGKRVLFVAEKRAALDAVIKRLSAEKVGLGHLVLDLHGADMSRKTVMERLKTTLEWIRDPGRVADEQALLQAFEARRRLLNEHAARINAREKPLDMSFVEVLGRLLRVPREARPELRIPQAAFLKYNPAMLRELFDAIDELAVDPELVLESSRSLWARALLDDGALAQRALEEVRQLLESLTNSTGEGLLSAMRTLQAECPGLALPSSLKDARETCALLARVAQGLEVHALGLYSLDLEALQQGLEPASRGFWARSWAFMTSAAYRSALKQVREQRRDGNATPARLHEEVTEAVAVRQRWRELLKVEEVRELPSAPRLLEACARFDEVISHLRSLMLELPDAAASFETLTNGLRALLADSTTAFRLPKARAVRRKLSEAGLGSFLVHLRETGTHAAARLQFEHVVFSTQREHILAKTPQLASFRGRAHEKLVEEFGRLDEERVAAAAVRVRHRHACLAIEAMNAHPDEVDLVTREANKRARHLPLRRLLEKAPNVLTRVAPCWVASPLSVSQLLAPIPELFDLVIFDEGSQVLPEDAIPALYRARQVVVAGDQHQMPPTTFFASAEEEEAQPEEQGADVPVTGGYESLLAALESFLPNRMLQWHYRSEDERLISFSNAEVYSNRLITFPSARLERAIEHIHVPHDPSLANQDESASREVERVVSLVLEHARTRPTESLGVIALSIKHALRLEAAIQKAVQKEPELASFFELEREERFFVKNLERVQGDERDAIILSIGHGKTPSGDLPLRFGPLLQNVGYRRLNVAITRARRRMTVVSSFLPQDIDLKRSSARGVAMLKGFLEYAANGGTRFVGTERAEEVPLNAFEEDIRRALEARGISLRGQYGASRFRIDLVAMHPQRKGQPILAIECDGASYHSGRTARDRDLIRQNQLEKLGWVFHRIWSTDWFQDREAEIERAVQAYEAAVQRADSMGHGPRVTAASERAERHEPSERPAPARAPRPAWKLKERIDDYEDEEIRRVFDWIASDGLNRVDDEILDEARELLGFGRMGSRVRERLTTCLGEWKSSPRSP